MAEFNVNDKFDPSKGYDGIRFGSDSVLLETELNELQKIQNHARAEIYRAMVHSGALDVHPNILTAGIVVTDTQHGRGRVGVPYAQQYSIYTNALGLSTTDFIVNGYKLAVEKFNTPTAGTNVIRLPEPPTEGTRDDLIFLEVWFEEVDSIKDPAIKDARIGEETSRRTKLNWRIRAVAGVDFETFKADGFHLGILSNGANAYSNVTAQGGNSSPLGKATSTNQYDYVAQSFSNALTRSATNTKQSYPDDLGLYIAGRGVETKDLLKTADGYVYAIPLFRVKRRNSGGYSQNNGNGARDYFWGIFNSTANSNNFNPGETRQFIAPSDVYPKIKKGDKFSNSSGSPNYLVEVISLDGDNKVTIKHLGAMAHAYTTTLHLLNSDRPDGKFANIIHQDDIIDLRHKVSLTGVNYDQLLEENFDKLLRGELRTKEGQKMLKTYHGVPKTPIDANHVFYASMDGTTVPERGTAIINGLTSYAPSPNGLGVRTTATSMSYAEFALSNLSAITFDLFAKITDTVGTGSRRYITFIANADSSAFVALFIDPSTQNITVFHSFNSTVNNATYPKNMKKVDFEKWYHFRIVTVSGELRVYVNGELYATITNPAINPTIYTRALAGFNMGGWSFSGAMSDISISNIDRGATFATLPKDFIDGYAVIDKAFNMQRRNLSDAQTSQYTTSIAKPKSLVSDRGITVAKGTGVNETIFEPGDKIKVKGIAGEIITGVIDTDTALAKVVFKDNQNYTNSLDISLDDVSRIAVNDTLQFTRVDGTTSVVRTVTAINTTNKTVTFSGAVSLDSRELWYVYETTVSTSSPIVKFGDADVVKTVAGTWTNLGTNEATFTLGENVNLDTEDVFIEYSLNSPNGQGGVPEVLTEVLEGQYLGQKYVKGIPTLKADFRGKVKGSVAENPHKAFTRNSQNFEAPNVNVTEITSYDLLSSVNGQPFLTTSTNISGQSIQQIFSLDLIAEVERQFGRIPKATKAEKVQWLKDNLAKYTCIWNGFGSSVGGNKATVTTWRADASAWHASLLTTTSSTVAKVTFAVISMAHIDSNGFVHFIAYAEPSDGVTPSVINTDYVELEIEFKSLTGYDTLTPAEPFHNGAQKNFFFIRKETKEIEMMFNCDEDYGVVTWGNYVPYQGVGSSGQDFKIIKVMDAFISTVGTGARSITANEAIASKPLSVHLPLSTPDYLLLNDNVLVGNDGVDLINTATSREINSGLKLRKLPIGGYRSLLPVGKMVRLATYPNVYALRGFNTSSSEGYQAVYTNFMLNQYVSTLYPRVVAIPMLVKIGSKLCLFVTTDTTNTRSLSISTFANSASDLYELPGRMLIKEDN